MITKKLDSDKILCAKAFNIAKTSKYDGYQGSLASLVYIFFEQKTARGAVNNKVMQNRKLAEWLHKPVIKKIKKQKVYSSFRGNIWGADLVDLQLISKFNKRIHFLLCFIDLFSEYAYVIPLKDKNVIAIINSFQKS